MGRKRLEETRRHSLSCYTTDDHARRVHEYVNREGGGLTLSAWLLNQVKQVVPEAEVEEVSLTNA